MRLFEVECRSSNCSSSVTASENSTMAATRCQPCTSGRRHLPDQQLRRVRLDDIAKRVFREWDSDALWAVATAGADAEHGTRLVVSERAATEATRLVSQALTIEATRLDDSLVRQATGMAGPALSARPATATLLESFSTAPPRAGQTVSRGPATTPPRNTSHRQETSRPSSCWSLRTD
jgi:hypothetical protein